MGQSSIPTPMPDTCPNETESDNPGPDVMDVEEGVDHFREMMAHLKQVFWIKNATKTGVIYVSPAYEAIWGRTCQSLYDDFQSFADSIHPEDRKRLAETGAEHKAEGKEEEFRILRSDGDTRWIRSRSYPVYNDQAEVVRYAGIDEDVTELHLADHERCRLEAQFIEAQKMEVVGQLAGGVAHDFNNILAVVIGYNDLISQDLGAEHPLHKYTEEIRNASQRASALTRQLLVFSRREVVQIVVLNLNSVVASMDKMLRRLVDENTEMIFICPREIGQVRADSGYIGQLLMNLVVNARDAMPDGGKLTIETSTVALRESDPRLPMGAHPGSYVVLSVSDTGTGMTDDVKAHLFEAFFTTKPLGKGTGLGLKTCQTIVQQCGGFIEVSSEVDKGTAFHVYFPRIDEPIDPAAMARRTGLLQRGTETLLLVEDEPALRNLAQSALQIQGYTILLATDGYDGLRVVREHQGAPIDLVITDVIMPKMGGKDMAHWLKTIYPDLKVLFTSGYTDDAIGSHGVLDPGVEFLPKPYTRSGLSRKVREMLDAR